MEKLYKIHLDNIADGDVSELIKKYGDTFKSDYKKYLENLYRKNKKIIKSYLSKANNSKKYYIYLKKNRKENSMKIDNEILEIIDSGHSEDNIYFLPNIQLNRKTYLKVNKVLNALGGKWNRKAKGHIFNNPIEDAIENVVLTGEVIDKKKELQFFETPTDIADQLCVLANAVNLKNKVIWEPEAGKGKILESIKKFNPDSNIYWFEYDIENSNYIKTLSIGKQLGNNFLECKIEDEKKLPDFVIMNPPFSKQQDIDHVLHALNHLKKGGTLISIMSPSIKFRTNKKTKSFMEAISKYDFEIKDLPSGSFKESGTMVNTIILKITK